MAMLRKKCSCCGKKSRKYTKVELKCISYHDGSKAYDYVCKECASTQEEAYNKVNDPYPQKIFVNY